MTRRVSLGPLMKNHLLLLVALVVAALVGIAVLTLSGQAAGNEPGTIRGVVWLDANNNGTVDEGERRLAGATVWLIRMDIPGKPSEAMEEVATATVDAKGEVVFPSVSPGTYALAATAPDAGVAWVGGVQLRTKSTQVILVPIRLPPYPYGTIKGFVFLDENGNGRFDPPVEVKVTEGVISWLGTALPGDNSWRYSNGIFYVPPEGNFTLNIRPGWYLLSYDWKISPTAYGGHGSISPKLAAGEVVTVAIGVRRYAVPLPVREPILPAPRTRPTPEPTVTPGPRQTVTPWRP